MFTFLKYLQPTDYFSLRRDRAGYVFPIVSSLPDSIIIQLQEQDQYKTQAARDLDMSWQAIKRGYVGEVPTYQKKPLLDLQDEYVFIRLYFSKAWVYYVLILRLLMLKHPIREISAFFKTRYVHRNQNVNDPFIYDNTPNQVLLPSKQDVKVSVVIPTLNRYTYLQDVLRDLEKQDYKHFEVIVVDQSDTFQPDFYTPFQLDIQVIRQDEKALWLARNTAILKATGSLIALSEDDVRIASNWISSHLRCLDFFGAQVSAGVFYPEGQSIPQNRSFFAVASQFATGNAMLYKSVFEAVGLFDRQFEKQRMGDGEFGLRVYLAGIRSVSNPEAFCIDVKAGTGGLRDMGSWDAFRTKSLWDPRPIPSVLYYFRRYYGDQAAKYAILKTVPLSMMPYRFKRHKALKIVGVFVSLFLLPVVVYQVWTSWRLASKKLAEGPKIEYLT